MVTGGCAGSTAGGIKIIRIVTTAKLFGLELEKSYRPHVVRPIKVGSRCIDEPQRASVLAYVLGFFVIVAIGASLLLITERNISVATAISATIVSLNNIGPGFDQVGAIQNYGWFSFPGKLIISLLMPIGRLEVFAVLVIFMPKFWRVN
jgi:trk system potassium uptake protein TrkH